MKEPIGKHWLARAEQWLWQADQSQASRSMRGTWHSARIAFAVGRDMIDGHLTLYAMSLVYTTLLSIVPFLALSFSVLKGFGVHNQLEPMLEKVLVAPLGPEKGALVVQNVLAFVDNIKVGVLGSVGLALLIYTVISLVQKIEFSFNEIWHINQNRSIGQRFSSYLSVIVIGPVLVFAALGATATVVNTDLAQRVTEVDQISWLVALLSRLIPYIVIVGLFTFLYTFIPNTKVKLRHAFAGGVVAGLAWQTAGFAFTLFAAGSTRYDAIYSGFAVGIMVLIWLYLTWLILLVGASVAYYSQHVKQITRARFGTPSASLDEYAGLAIAYKVARNFDETGGGTPVTVIESELPVGPETIRRMIAKLTKHQVLVLVNADADELIPARSLDRVTLNQLLHILRSSEDPLPLSLGGNRAVNEITSRIEDTFDEMWGEKTVAEWVRSHESQIEG